MAGGAETHISQRRPPSRGTPRKNSPVPAEAPRADRSGVAGLSFAEVLNRLSRRLPVFAAHSATAAESCCDAAFRVEFGVMVRHRSTQRVPPERPDSGVSAGRKAPAKGGANAGCEAWVDAGSATGHVPVATSDDEWQVINELPVPLPVTDAEIDVILTFLRSALDDILR